ncbi:NB-ARC domain-containing protein [Crossiella sp. CA198]|uniref:NB-ARC domain-containing protein n=1 Tax=Crossiella sp. CA198 TaxID=3455607 RepID=UPI003F8D71FD
MSGPVHGTVIQANSIGGLVITAQAPVFAPPRQLPPGPHGFVNRGPELRRLSDLLLGGDRDRPGVVVVSGMGGVGKTAVGLHWARRHSVEFPGGQLYADLAAYRQRGSVEVSDVLGAFIRAMGVHDDYIPADLAERAALFRTRTAAAPMLVLLDNVDQAAQVRPLLPGSAASAVIVTSRSRLSGLLIDGAMLLEIQPLDHEDASALVVHMLPVARAHTETEALRELARQCGGLPLALRIAGARLAQRPCWPVDRLVRELADERFRLSRLAMAEDHQVELVFDAVYLDLPEPIRRGYRRLALLPGLDFDLPAVAVGFGVDEEAAAEILATLCESNLVEERGLERYRLHDLVLLHARRWLEREESMDEIAIGQRAVISWYLTGAAAADRAVLGKNRWRCAEVDVSRWPISFSPASAMTWFELERSNLLGACRIAAGRLWHEHVWQLCEALWALYDSHKHYADWIETHQLGVIAAQECEDQTVEVRMRNQLARAYLGLSDFARAGEELDRAWAVARAAEDPRTRAVVTESRGLLYRDEGSYGRAGKEFRAARRIYQKIGELRGAAIQAYHLGDVVARSGRAAQAVPLLLDALRDSQELGDDMLAARVRVVLGSAYGKLRRTAEARSALIQAVAVTRDRAQPIKEALALETLVEVAEQDPDPKLFESSARRLAELYQETGSPRLAVVHDWLVRGTRASD